MNHESKKRLELLRWIIIGYSFSFLVGYVYVNTRVHSWSGNRYYSFELFILVLVQLIYEGLVYFKLIKISGWLATVTTLVFGLIETLVVISSSNNYSSPYAFFVVILIFLSGTLWKYLPPILAFIICTGYLLGLVGQSNNVKATTSGLVFVGGTIVAALLGYFIWNKFMDANDEPKIKNLTTMLNNDNQQSEIIIQAIGDGVIVVDNQGQINLMNPAAAMLTEWSVKDSLDIDYRSVIQLTQEDGKPLRDNGDLFTEVLQNNKSYTRTVLLVGRNKKQTIVSIVVSPILLQNHNQVVGAVAVFHDVTEQRRAEQQRADFISTASHEMRTPVAAIEGYLSLAMNNKVSNIDTKARDFLGKAHQSTQQLGKLFQDLLTSSRADDGRLVNHPQVVEMSQFVQTKVDSFQLAATEKHLIVDFVVMNNNEETQQITGKVITPLYYVHVDPDRISEVITNLFDNAVKYTDAGKITIGIGGDNNNVQIYIQDTGAGISVEDVPHLFQKFYRVDNSAVRSIGGTGLGLYICKKIVELYSGQIWVESEPGKGSVFHINLPRLSTQQAESLKRTELLQDQIAMPSSNVTL